MLLSLIYEGRFYAFLPFTYLDRIQLAVIRPLIYVSEANVIGLKINTTFRYVIFHTQKNRERNEVDL